MTTSLRCESGLSLQSGTCSKGASVCSSGPRPVCGTCTDNECALCTEGSNGSSSCHRSVQASAGRGGTPTFKIVSGAGGSDQRTVLCHGGKTNGLCVECYGSTCYITDNGASKDQASELLAPSPSPEPLTPPTAPAHAPTESPSPTPIDTAPVPTTASLATVDGYTVRNKTRDSASAVTAFIVVLLLLLLGYLLMRWWSHAARRNLSSSQ